MGPVHPYQGPVLSYLGSVRPYLGPVPVLVAIAPGQLDLDGLGQLGNNHYQIKIFPKEGTYSEIT